MFSSNNFGDCSNHSRKQDFLWTPLNRSSAMQSSTWCYRRHFQPTPVALSVPVYRNLIKPNIIFGNPTFPLAYHHQLYHVNYPAISWYQKPKAFLGKTQLCSQRMKMKPSFAIGAGDAPLPIEQPRTLFSNSTNQYSVTECHNQSTGTEDIQVNIKSEESNWRPLEKGNAEPSSTQDESKDSLLSQQEVSESDAERDKKSLLTSIEKFLQRIMDLYNKLNYRNCISSIQYKSCITNLLVDSRHYFYKLESIALSQILKENDDWEETSCVADIFHHDYFSMADILSVYLLQLILAVNEYGYINVDPTGSDPLSILSFYRGEFRLGRVLPGVYQMHITSYQYTACTKMLQATDECPLRSGDGKKCNWKASEDIQADTQHWSTCKDCDPFHMESSHDSVEEVHLDQQATSSSTDDDTCSKGEDASNLLKMLYWRVRFVQNPDLEEESYYLCCKAVKPYMQEPEYIFQSDSFKYFFGKMVSPRLNFVNPSLNEIVLTCRPTGRFEVIHSFGSQLPMYSVVVGILVDYLRHKRFKRTVF